MGPVKNNKDPLEMARNSLDFAAMAAVAPSAKDILFKAQTMVPLSPAKPWYKVSTWTVMSVLVCALVFAPWLPSTSSITLFNVTFVDKSFKRPEAQELTLRFVREMPEYALLGVQYDAKGDEAAQLAMRIDAVNRSPHEINARVKSIFEGHYYRVRDRQIWVRHFNSPFMHIIDSIGAKSEPRSREADSLAREILAAENVFAEGVKRALAAKGNKLEKFAFLNSRTISGDLEYDFTIEAWPRQVGVCVEHYPNLTDSEQEQIRETAYSFLRDANLVDTGMLLTTQPQQWLPVIIHVVDSNGTIDARLSAKAQAEMVQPTDEELMAFDYDVDVPVKAALNAVLPGNNFTLDYSHSNIGGSHYVVKARVAGISPRPHPLDKRNN